MNKIQKYDKIRLQKLNKIRKYDIIRLQNRSKDQKYINEKDPKI